MAIMKDISKSKPTVRHRASSAVAGRRVVIAMSGGVDSSVAAGLLKKQGYDVVGIFMKLWTDKTSETDLVRENICCSLDAATAARAVADKLGIPFYVVNFADEFKKYVVDYYISEYEKGRTPNPCVICNRDIKGEILLRKAGELNADYLATGHYARIEDSRNSKFEARLQACISKQILNNKIQKKKNEYHLLKSKDTNKDQTYFLWTLSQEKLAKLLFPVGGYSKPQIRKMAKEMGLPTAERRESQGICFIPDRDVCGFLHRHAKKLTKSGPIKDTTGKTIGTHDGLINYTIGQRQHLGLGGPKSYYVVELDSRKNTLVVGENKDLFRDTLIVSNINWINNNLKLKIKNLKLSATIRYRHPTEKCRIENIDKDSIKVIFYKPQRAITPGQSIVFYSGEEVLGGGIID